MGQRHCCREQGVKPTARSLMVGISSSWVQESNTVTCVVCSKTAVNLFEFSPGSSDLLVRIQLAGEGLGVNLLFLFCFI